jgi:hypothetical protein
MLGRDMIVALVPKQRTDSIAGGLPCTGQENSLSQGLTFQPGGASAGAIACTGSDIRIWSPSFASQQFFFFEMMTRSMFSCTFYAEK